MGTTEGPTNHAVVIEYRTDRRGYTMWLERDLFGAFVLYRRWRGLHNRRGGMKRQVFEREDDALKEVRRVMRLRERHGYVLVGQ
ncbi:WGR domain-containing protein [Thiobacter aerophilum]|uniref:WGR domain-containing protein n=1 Tax=Thiobacter aerophilum TaxID=3121275 RepID=A0ABV0EK59_9BURK